LHRFIEYTTWHDLPPKTYSTNLSNYPLHDISEHLTNVERPPGLLLAQAKYSLPCLSPEYLNVHAVKLPLLGLFIPINLCYGLAVILVVCFSEIMSILPLGDIVAEPVCTCIIFMY